MISNNTSSLSPLKKGVVGVQFLFVAFGATVLVPLLVGFSPAAGLFSAGLGTLIFHLVTRRQVPIFLGSNFTFIAPIIAATQQWGTSGALTGILGVASVYILMSFVVKWQGAEFIKRLFPPVVIGMVIILIGLTLLNTAVNMASEHWGLAMISLASAIAILTFGKGLIKLTPVVVAIVIGYLAAIPMGLVDFSSVATAPWFALPPSLSDFQMPQFAWQPFLFMMPIAAAAVIEHVGDVYVVGSVAKKDFISSPGLHRTMLGDGLACASASLLGGPPVTTFLEVTGAMSITKVTSPQVIRIAAITAIILSVFGKLSALLQSIPTAILGGIMLLLFGTIASVGVQNLIQNKVDMGSSRNIIICSIMLATGIGSTFFYDGNFVVSGVGLSAIIGIILNLILPKEKEL